MTEYAAAVARAFVKIIFLGICIAVIGNLTPRHSQATEFADARAEEVFEALKANIEKAGNPASTRILVKQKSIRSAARDKKATEEYIAKSIERVEKNYGSDPALEERKAAAIFDARTRMEGTSTQTATILYHGSGPKWRIDTELNEWVPEFIPTDDLKNNPYLSYSDFENLFTSNRDKTMAWDNLNMWRITRTERFGASFGINAKEQNYEMAQKITQLANMPHDYVYGLSMDEFRMEVVSEDENSVTLKITKEGSDFEGTIIVAPQQGYSVLSWDFKSPNTHEFGEASGYKEIDGVWFPAKRVETRQRLVDGQWRTWMGYEWEVEEADFDAGIDDSVFTPEIPDGSRVKDNRVDPALSYRQGEDAQKNKDELYDLLEDIEDNTENDSKAAIIIFIVAAVLAVAIIVILKRKKRAGGSA